jgi:hypothetical protein
MNHSPLIFRAPHNHRPVAEQGIKSLFHRGKKSIRINMHNEALIRWRKFHRI